MIEKSTKGQKKSEFDVNQQSPFPPPHCTPGDFGMGKEFMSAHRIEFIKQIEGRKWEVQIRRKNLLVGHSSLPNDIYASESNKRMLVRSFAKGSC